MLEESIKLDLDSFHGTTEYHRVGVMGKGVMTDGVKYVCEMTGIESLLQDIAIEIELRPKVNKAFRSDRILAIDIDTQGNGVKILDGMGKVVKKFPCYGYKGVKIRLFSGAAPDGIGIVFCLPSEY